MSAGTAYYPPYGADTGNWETHRVALALSRIGVSTGVALPRCASGSYEYSQLKIGPGFVSNRHTSKLLFALSLRRKVNFLIKKGYNIFHFHGPIPAAFSIDKVKDATIPCVVTWGDPYLGAITDIHRPFDIVKVAQGTQRLVQLFSTVAQKIVLDQVDRVICVSRHQKNRLAAVYRFDDSRIDVVPPGVDTDSFRPGLDTTALRLRYSIRENERVIICPARIAPMKRQSDLLLALSLLGELKENLKVLFVGDFTDGTYLNRLRSLSRELGIEGRIVFTGVVPYDEFPVHYNLADIVVLPSIGEGLPSSVLEAMSCGRPVIASSIPPNIETAAGGKGVAFYNPTNYEELAGKLNELISNPLVLSEMSVAARETVLKYFTWEIIAKQTLQVYFRAIEEQ